eukprot:m.81387 g.81387  ORF g.81387 m.81387 type:complete len:403 (-) comp14571_c0_seq2:199-1407(-)
MSAAPIPDEWQASFEQFFNDLELKEHDEDVDLLLQAERRGLLNRQTEALLAEARRRGLAPPKRGSGTPLERYQVYYIGAASLYDVPTSRLPTIDEVQTVLRKISQNPRMGCEAVMIMEIYPLIVKLYDVTEEEKPRSRTLERVKALTLRKFTGGRRPHRNLEGLKVDDSMLVVEHNRESIKTFLAYNKTVACVTQGRDDITGKDLFTVHAYRFEDKRKALEIANHLRQAHEGLTQRQQQAEENRAPIERINLERTEDQDFGISVIGPKVKSEFGDGLFISNITPGSPADRHPLVKVGLQILRVNAVAMEDYTMAECRDSIQQSGQIVVLDLQANPHGYALYQYRQGHLQPRVNYGASDEEDAHTATTEDSINELLTDFVGLSANTDFTNPVTIDNQGMATLN